MTRPEPQRGFVLLLVLVAAAVLSLIAAFIYSRTEDQLLMSVAARGQSIAAARATLAAERKLAIYRAAYPGGLTIVTPAGNYDSAADAGYVADREFQNLDKATWPALELSNGGGANWCTETWLMDRGPGVPPWTVVEAFGFYGYTVQTAGIDFNHCNPVGNPRIVSSRVTVYLETPPGPGGAAPPCPACGTGTVGGS